MNNSYIDIALVRNLLLITTSSYEKNNLLNVDEVKLNILEVPIYYTNTIKYLDIKRTFSNSLMPIGRSTIYSNANNNTVLEEDDNDDVNEYKFQAFLYPFSTEHLLKLISEDFNTRMRNTIFYLISIYILSEKIKPVNYFTKKWLYNLSIKNMVENFLTIFYILKQNIVNGLLKIDSNTQNWVILCLKYLLINNNISENIGKNIILGAVKTIKIPHVIEKAIFNNERNLYELIALYKPIIREHNYVSGMYDDSNNSNSNNNNNNNSTCSNDSTMKVATEASSSAMNPTNKKQNPMKDSLSGNDTLNYIWNGDEWIHININNLKNFFLTSPELYYIARLIYSQQNCRPPSPPPPPPPSPPPPTPPPPIDVKKEKDGDNQTNKKRKINSKEGEKNKKIKKTEVSVETSSILAKNKKQEFNLCLTDIINQILIYWCDIYTIKPPSYFWKMIDSYILLGGKDQQNNLIDIHFLPMYNDSNNNSYNINCREINSMVNHMMSCSFVQEQIFPLFREKFAQLEKQNLEDQGVHDEQTLRLRHKIDSKKSYKKTYMDLEEALEAEINRGYNISNDDDDDDDDDNDNDKSNDDEIKKLIQDNIFWKYKSKLRNMTRDQYHFHIVNNLNSDKVTLELIKLVKYNIIYHMSTSYKDMKTAKISHEILQRYVNKKDNKTQRMKDIAQCLYTNLYSDALSAQLSDILPHEMTQVTCFCPVAKTFLYLFQTFSYDLDSIRFILSKIILAMFYGINLDQKQLYIFLGDTNSGKTRFLKFLINLFGNKAGIISSRTSYYGTHQDRTHDIGKKAGTARFWYMDEVSHREFNREFFNQLTGSSPMFLRTNYTEGKMIKVAPTVFIFGNNSPTFNENCPALIERLRYYTFRSEFNSNIPICFKYCKFPQMSNFDKNQGDLQNGFLSILLHAICFSNCNSPLFIHKGIINTPYNVRDSTIMNAPTINIVKEIRHQCNLQEDAHGILTVRRLVYLINNLPHNILKSVRVANTTDIIRFFDKIYPKSKVDNKKIPCAATYKDDFYSLVYIGLLEYNSAENDAKIQKGKKRKF